MAARLVGRALLAMAVVAVCAIGALYWDAGLYGLNVVLRRGGTIWSASSPTDPRLSPAMRLVLSGHVHEVKAGAFEWRQIQSGFEVAELPVVADGREVDRIMLARIDPSDFRFEVRNRTAGDEDLAGWMHLLGAALVINGSYFSLRGTPDTPVVSVRHILGPTNYEATHGAFVASSSAVEVRDLANGAWRAALANADNAMVSYPMLIGNDGKSRTTPSNWLANRSFVAQDQDGRIILGTTVDAFFSIDRLAEFLKSAPLQIKTALNLDGGPVACQGIALAGFVRSQCGSYELKSTTTGLELLKPLFGNRQWAMPIVLAVYPK